MNTLIDDNATATDLLDRNDFALAVTRLIADSPNQSSFRVGVYGEWGEGKTSVLKMIESSLTEDGIACVPFVPWSYQTQEAMLEGLVATIVTTLDLHPPENAQADSDLKKGALAVGGVVNDVLKSVKDAHWTLKILSPLVDRAVQGKDKRLKDWQDKNLLEALMKRLETQRLVILVDDLDRVRPELLPDLLLNIREALDLPNLFYVLALSPSIVKDGLMMVHQGWKDAYQFLEKIIEYPLFLPKPDKSTLNRFVHGVIKQISANDDVIPYADVLSDLAPLMPQNPRKIKSFLRYLQGLSGQIQRFSPDEISIYDLYLSQILVCEFPYQARQLVEQRTILEGFRHDFLRPKRSQNEKREDVPEAEFTPADKLGSERFLKLCEEMKRGRSMASRGQYGFVEMFTLIDHPPQMTWLELDKLFNAIADLTGEAQKDLVDNVVSPRGVRSASRASKLLEMVVEGRSRLLNGIRQQHSAVNAERSSLAVRGPNTVLHTLFEELDLLKENQLDAGSLRKLVESFGMWSRWRSRQASVLQERAWELAFIEGISIKIPPEQYQECYDIFGRAGKGDKGSLPGDDYSTPFMRLSQKVADRLEREIATSVLNRFGQIEGVERVFRNDHGDYERSFLFNIDSPFYATRFRRLFATLCRERRSDEVVQANLIEYFDTLVSVSTTTGWDSQVVYACKRVVNDADLLRTLWRGIIAKTLSPSAVVRLDTRRNTLLGSNESLQHAMPLPKWWKSVLDMGSVD